MKLKYGMQPGAGTFKSDYISKERKNTNKLATKEGFILFQTRLKLYISTGMNNEILVSDFNKYFIFYY